MSIPKLGDMLPEQLIEAAEASLDESGRCWTGYEPVPGKKAYEKGSCRKIGEGNVALPMVKKSL